MFTSACTRVQVMGVVCIIIIETVYKKIILLIAQLFFHENKFHKAQLRADSQNVNAIKIYSCT